MKEFDNLLCQPYLGPRFNEPKKDELLFNKYNGPRIWEPIKKLNLHPGEDGMPVKTFEELKKDYEFPAFPVHCALDGTHGERKF
jgi:hypothetical protein